MSDLITLEAVDTDGAIREAEEAVAGDTRADLFRKAALTGGAVVGGGLLLGGFPDFALAGRPSKKQDVRILNFALTLEYLESEFYKEALQKANLQGELLTTTQEVSRHENAHVRFLKLQLGSARKPKPKFDFMGMTSDAAKYLDTAVDLEDTGVKAYSGQAPRILQKAVLKAAASILTVEARHASRFRTLAGRDFAPKTFDKPLTAKQVLAKAGAFIA